MGCIHDELAEGVGGHTALNNCPANAQSYRAHAGEGVGVIGLSLYRRTQGPQAALGVRRIVGESLQRAANQLRVGAHAFRIERRNGRAQR